MDKYIGFDIDDKKTVACIVQIGKKDACQTLQTDVEATGHWLKQQRKGSDRLQLTRGAICRGGRWHDGSLTLRVFL